MKSTLPIATLPRGIQAAPAEDGVRLEDGHGAGLTITTNSRGGIGFRDPISGKVIGNYPTWPDALRAAQRNGYTVPSKK
jgi:hypothetical protein